MVVKVYVSGISGNKEVKKHQQRVMMILDSKSIKYVTVDITEPGNENEKEFMQQNGKAKESKFPLPPQLFNDEDYCGDYEEFDLANEVDDLEKFLKLMPSVSKAEITLEQPNEVKEDNVPVANGVSSSRENSSEKDVAPKPEETDAAAVAAAAGDAASEEPRNDEANEEE